MNQVELLSLLKSLEYLPLDRLDPGVGYCPICFHQEPEFSDLPGHGLDCKLQSAIATLEFTIEFESLSMVQQYKKLVGQILDEILEG